MTRWNSRCRTQKAVIRMPDVTERLSGILTMSRKAGKLLLGFDAVKDAVKLGQVACVLLAADVSPKTEKEIRFYAGEVPVRMLPFQMDALKCFFRKRTAVYGVCDAGFAGKLLELMPEPAVNE